MAKTAAKENSETLQLVILTFAMTGGLFALLTGVLVLFLNVGAAEEAQQAEKSLGDLQTFLLSPEMRDLRVNAEKAKSQGATNTLGEIVQESMSQASLSCPNFPAITPKNLRPGLDEHRIKLTLNPAPLQQLIQFVGTVPEARRTIQVDSVSFKRDTRNKTEDDSWVCTVEFVEFVTK
ncbi:MAG TPA: hypothetical protein VFD71_12645 [Planctomycetota bacterium]|jgi:type II secretory pathway component PulM|nr:hypothetical protein [Planctomycetota bacterium]